MTEYWARAEFDKLQAVRVHRPGFETFAGAIDKLPNLFLDDFNVRNAQKEHDRLVDVLEQENVNVHTLLEDLESGKRLEDLLKEFVTVHVRDTGTKRREAVKSAIWTHLKELDPNMKFQSIVTNLTLDRRGYRHDDEDYRKNLGTRGLGIERKDSTSLTFDQPLSNLLFQRDQQILTANGPILCKLKNSTRRPESRIVGHAWEAIGAEIVADLNESESHSVPEEHRSDVPESVFIEGGDFFPVGEFALLGVGGTASGLEQLRTTYAAGHKLIADDVLGVDEVGLVRAPYANAEDLNLGGSEDVQETEMDIMHLDTWFNIAEESLAVGIEPLLETAVVDVFVHDGDGWTVEETCTFAEYLSSKGFTVIPVPLEESTTATNFLTLDDGKVLPVYQPDSDGDYRPGQNRTIERLRNHGVEIVPNGVGIDIQHLRSGYGGIHCLTTPLLRT